MSARTVLSVGQCSMDHAALTRLISSAGGTLVRLNLHAEIASAIAKHQPVLILINRLNDSDGSSGIACISQLRTDSSFDQIPIMLVSNLAEAQSEAVKNGATQGFGKSSLHSAATLTLLKQQLMKPVE